MKSKRFSFRSVFVSIALFAVAILALRSNAFAQQKSAGWPEKVGDAGDPDSFQFEGLQTFTADQIRRALALKPGYLLAAHPKANFRPFLEELQQRLRSGYQASGFPDAQVHTEYDGNRKCVAVRVEEGPRFRTGRVRVEGGTAETRRELVRWFTTPANKSPEYAGYDERAGLTPPGKAERSSQPMWSPGDAVDFSESWATQAVAQVEACLAEAGCFFPETRVSFRRAAATGLADLMIDIANLGPPGVVGEIEVTGQKLHNADEIIHFLQLKPGMKITAARLVEARRQLRDCGRFWDYEVTPEYHGTGIVSSRQVNLKIKVAELEGVPRLTESLRPTQQALVRVCEWLERFPARKETISARIKDLEGFPVDLDFALSPRNGLMVNLSLGSNAPAAAGFLLTGDTVQLCAWGSSNRVAKAREGGGEVFVHLVPYHGEGSNRFTLTIGGGYRGKLDTEAAKPVPLLKFDVQLSRAAFVELASNATVVGRSLLITNDGFQIRADAKNGRILETTRPADQAELQARFNDRSWPEVVRDFNRRAAALTNTYLAEHEFSSLLALVAGETARFALLQSATTNVEQRRLAGAAVRRLITSENLAPLNLLAGIDTNEFKIPMNELETAMAQNSLVTLFSGFAFDWSTRVFPKNSWPWTLVRESAFVMMNQGQYTDEELERLCAAEETGPVGLLAIGWLLERAGSPTARTVAVQGLVRMSAKDFLQDCRLFLRGDKGLARSFARVAESLRTMPEDELAGLVAALPEPEGRLLRDSHAALQARPADSLEAALSPVLTRYWNDRLRAVVRAEFYRLSKPKSPQQHAALENARG